MSELTPSDYELSRSRLGPIIRILRAADGELLDGFHRLEANPSWPEEILPHIKTPRQKLAVKIAANAMRRRTSDDEVAHYVQQLAEEIVKEGVSRGEVIREICLDTGLKDHVIRTYLRKGQAEEASSTPPVIEPRARRAPKDDEEMPLEMPETPKMPERDSVQFQESLEETVGMLMGLPVSEIWGRLTAIFGISPEEAQNYVKRFRTSYQDIWNKHYDSHDRPIIREEGPVDEAYEEDGDYSHAEEVPLQSPMPPPPPGIQYSYNELLASALRYYPDEVVNQVWDTIGVDSRKIPFMKTLFYRCFAYAVESVGLEALLAQVANEVY